MHLGAPLLLSFYAMGMGFGRWVCCARLCASHWGSPSTYAGFRACSAILTVLVISAACQDGDRDDFQVGLDAYNQGNYQTAIEIWGPLAEGGDPAAQTNMGFLYYHGRGVPLDYEEAVEWYRLAVSRGYADAAFNLGVAYAEGNGVEQDFDEALKLYTAAAEAGYAPAQVIVGNIHFLGEWGVAVDHSEGVKWYLQAAKQDDVVAQFLMANVYLNGQGVPPDLVQAYKWLLVAQAGDHPDAQENGEGLRLAIAAALSPEQIAEAEQLAEDWQAASPSERIDP